VPTDVSAPHIAPFEEEALREFIRDTYDPATLSADRYEQLKAEFGIGASTGGPESIDSPPQDDGSDLEDYLTYLEAELAEIEATYREVVRQEIEVASLARDKPDHAEDRQIGPELSL
jgi:hypothetical protein